MKMNVALAAVTLALMGAGSAHAAGMLDITFTGTSATPFSTFAYGADITNNSGMPLFIGGDSLAVTDPSNIAFDLFSDLVLSPIVSPSGYEIPDGGVYSTNDLFELTTPDGGIFSLFDPNAGVLATQGFTPAGFNVPEPGSVALLVGSMMGGGLFLARRRRK